MQKGKTDEAERWKTKYLHNLDELEHKEKEWAELEAMLHRGIGRLAVSGYGINPLLDRKLDKLREGVRRRRNSKDLDGMISIVSDTAIRLKEPDKQGSPPLPTKFLVTLLEGLELPPDLAREGKKLHKRLEKASESDDPAPLLESFKTLLHKGLNSQAPPGEATESSPPPQPQRGFLKRLLAPATPIPETAPTPAEIVPTPTPPEIHTQASSTGSETPSLDQDGRLLQLLLEQCELPEISHSEAEGLKERCATAQAQEIVEQLVSEIAAFLSRYLQDPEEDSRSPAPDSRPATNEILLQLLERFEVSSDMQGQVDSL
ncbi:MAG: hypothetical protein GY731_18900, partial [Gammaproteobacteria bacterium]|nr:hypothetical protein [Gammaproteobacteria bacterium]